MWIKPFTEDRWGVSLEFLAGEKKKRKILVKCHKMFYNLPYIDDIDIDD